MPGILNSASSSPLHKRSPIIRESGPGMRKSKQCRSPLKVSERQSTESAPVSKILSLEHAGPRDQRAEQGGRGGGHRQPSLAALQISEDAGDRPGPRVSSLAQIEHEARIAEDIASKPGRGRIILA